MTTFDCNFEEFKQLAKQFHDSAPSLSLEELDNAWKCFGLHYLGMYEDMWMNSAAILLKMEARTFSECEMRLLYETA